MVEEREVATVEATAVEMEVVRVVAMEAARVEGWAEVRVGAMVVGLGEVRVAAKAVATVVAMATAEIAAAMAAAMVTAAEMAATVVVLVVMVAELAGPVGMAGKMVVVGNDVWRSLG